MFDKIIFFVDSSLRVDFYHKLAMAYRCGGVDVRIICRSNFDASKFVKSEFSVKFITGYGRSGNINEDVVGRSIDVAAGFQTKCQAISIYSEAMRLMIEEVAGFSRVLIFGSNGYHTTDFAIRKISESRPNINTLFTEYGNIPGKTLIDVQGCNIKSFIYQRPDIALKDCSGFGFDEWVRKFVGDKDSSSTIIQAAKKRSFKDVVDRISGVIKDYFYRVPSEHLLAIRNFRIRMLFEKLRPIDYSLLLFDVEFSDEFVLFPMQVLNDSQLLLNSEIGIDLAISKAIDLASSMNCKLVVRPHPAETDRRVLPLLKKYLGDGNFIVSNSNTWDLVKRCKAVVTINSTVGLEARLIGKSVFFLEKNLFSELTNDQLAKYLTDYLLSVPLRGDYDVTLEMAEYIAGRSFV